MLVVIIVFTFSACTFFINPYGTDETYAMKEMISKLRDPILLLMLFGCIGAMVLSGLASNEMIPDLNEYVVHITAIIQAKLALADGQFPIRVAPLGHAGFHYPLFQFDSPTSYTLAGFLYQWLTPANPFIAYKLMIWLAIVAGGIYMYRLALYLFDNAPAALLASVMYLTTPYYLIVVDHLGNFSEAIALGIIPGVLFYTLQRYFNPSANKTLLQMSLAWYLLATVDVITFCYTSLFAALLLIVVTAKNPKALINLLDTGIAYLFGVTLALWYLGPVFIFRHYLNIPYVLSKAQAHIFTYFKPQLSNLLAPAQDIILPLHTQSGTISGWAVIHPNLGFPLLFAFIICSYAFFKRSTIHSTHAQWLGPLLAIFCVALLMIMSPFDLWAWMPHQLMLGLYSWRILDQAIWIGALLFAWALCWFFESRMDKHHIVLGLFLIIMATSAWIPITESGFTKYDMPGLIKNPVVPNDPDFYLLNLQKNIINARAIDSLSLNIFSASAPSINNSYPIATKHFRNAHHPALILKGHVTNNSYEDTAVRTIEVLINNKVIKSFALNVGIFKWEIPLTAALASAKKNPQIFLKFKIANMSDKLSVNIDNAFASGFINEQETLAVNQTQKECTQQKNITTCHVIVPPNIKLIELPAVYYPGMLHITVNDAVVPVSTVVNENYLLAAVEPVAHDNIIKIEFQGLLWANTLSETAWGLWVLFLAVIGIKMLTKADRRPRIH
jgi:hypothetical protein